jgi:hypothetical protein
MSLITFMNTKHGKIAISIILAIGLASILKLSLKSSNIIIITGPPLDNIKDKIFSFDSKCYTYKTVATSCKNLENNKSTLEKII